MSMRVVRDRKAERRLKRKLDRVPDEVARETVKALEGIGQLMTKTMTVLVPKETGQLARSIAYQVDVRQLALEVGTDDSKLDLPDQARWVEFGTKRMSAQPFLYPSHYANKRKIKARLSRAYTKGAKEAAGVK